MKDKFISVVCPVYNEEKYIETCIESIERQDFPKENLEVLFVDGLSKDRTREIISRYASKITWIRLLDNPKKIAPCAMNIGIKAAQGEVIIRIDAHASYEPNYFSALVGRLFELEAANVGTVCKTDVLNKTPKTLAIREVLSNRFGVGNSVFRTGITDVREVDTVPFGCWRKEAFEKYGLYDERLVRNQDFELNHRIKRGGGKIYIVPDSFCTYYARETYGKLAQQGYKNGIWNIRTLYYTGELSSLALRHYIPLIFVLSLIVPLVVGIFWRPALLVAGASLMAYCCLLGLVSFRLATKEKLNFIRLLQSFMVLHLSYGWGSLVSVVTLSFLKKQ